MTVWDKEEHEKMYVLRSKFREELKQDFPSAFRFVGDRHRFIEAWVGEGWHHLVRELSERVEENENKPYVVQIKEKLGYLHFYISWYDDDIRAAINAVCHKSMSVCEECGKPGELDESLSWIKTVCPEHKKARSALRDAYNKE